MYRMMGTLEFNSQVCTSPDQSKRLIALGLKKETADMILLKELTYDEKRNCLCDSDTYMVRPIDYLRGEEHRGNIPAWSLHRLIELSNMGIINTSTDNIYDKIIQYIEYLIKCGGFNKEYLND